MEDTQSRPAAQADEQPVAQAAPTATVCMIAKDEAPYLVEWLAHYIALGFDHVVVYDNASSDGSAALLQAAAARYTQVEYRAWPDRPGEAPQLGAYQDATARCSTGWIAFFDADELLVLKQHDTIAGFLARYPADAGAVLVNWLMFGSAGETAYRDELQATRFRMAARNTTVSKNQFVKSIARADAIEQVRTHCPDLRPGAHTYDADGQPVELLVAAKTAKPAHAVAQLNHYIVRSREEYADKQRRGTPAVPGDSTSKFAYRDEKFWLDHDTNHVADDAIDAWVLRAAPHRHVLAACAAAGGMSRASRG
jgi:glycosyltransferase involved in cell wall biosynthesis